ncbi:hypothetical protein GCM10022291_09270 [Postechiella marina]|uniref:Uncharacterized protein n=1 Tax=Postechiella marina TaxID=943941 RepID=A0ABP8C468_9FLAO
MSHSLKLPTTDTSLASSARIEKVTLQIGLLFKYCFEIAIIIMFVLLCRNKFIKQFAIQSDNNQLTTKNYQFVNIDLFLFALLKNL